MSVEPLAPTTAPARSREPKRDMASSAGASSAPGPTVAVSAATRDRFAATVRSDALGATLRRSVAQRAAARPVPAAAIQRFALGDITVEQRLTYEKHRNWYLELPAEVRPALEFDELQRRTTWTEFDSLIETLKGSTAFDPPPTLDVVGPVRTAIRSACPQVETYLERPATAALIAPADVPATPPELADPDLEGGDDFGVTLEDLTDLRRFPQAIVQARRGTARRTSTETTEVRVRVRLRTGDVYLVLVHYHPLRRRTNFLHLKSVAHTDANVRIRDFDHPVMPKLDVTQAHLDAAPAFRG